MSHRFSIAQAKNRFPALVHLAEEGSPVAITRRGQPVAMLISQRQYDQLGAQPLGYFAATERFRLAAAGELLEDDLPFDAVRAAEPGRRVKL